RGRAVCPLLWLDTTLRLLLDAVVTNGGRRVEGLPDLRVGGWFEITGVRGVSRPHARGRIRRQRDTDGLRARSGLGEESELVLHVVAVLVGHNVSLREGPALRAKALRQLLKEGGVEIDLLIVGAIEGSHRSLRETTCALRGPREQHGPGRQIGLAAARELVAPILLDTVDETDDPAILAFVRVRAGLTILHRRRAIDRRSRPGVVRERIHAEEERDDKDDQPDPAASDDDRPTQTTTSALILDLRRIERLVPAKRHVSTDRHSTASR